MSVAFLSFVIILFEYCAQCAYIGLSDYNMVGIAVAASPDDDNDDDDNNANGAENDSRPGPDRNEEKSVQNIQAYIR